MYTHLCKYESRVFLSTLSVYIQCKYYQYGSTKNDRTFMIDSKAIEIIYDFDSDLADVVKNIISVRNAVSHSPWNPNTFIAMDQLFKDESFRRFLVFEKLMDEDGNYIEPESGRYLPVDRAEYDKIKCTFKSANNESGNESDNSDKTNVKCDAFINAVSKMSE